MNDEPDTLKDLEREIRALKGELKKARHNATRWEKRFRAAERPQIHHLKVETRSFEWEAFAGTTARAWHLLKQCWNKHKSQYSDDLNVPWMTWQEFKENVIVQNVIPMDCALRDGELMIGGDA